MAKKPQNDSAEYLEAVNQMNEETVIKCDKKLDLSKLENSEPAKVEVLNAEGKPAAQAPTILVKIDKEGVVNFGNQIELSQAASFIIQMKLAPEHLRKDGKEVVMAALTLCRQYRLPLSALNEMAAIKGKVGVFGTLMTALAQRHPDFGEMKVQYINEEQSVICLANKNLKDSVWACVISIRKQGSNEWNEYFFTKDEAQTAGLLGSNTYQKYLKDMLFHRAKARAFNTEYASALKGIESAENMTYEAQARDLSPVEEMNKRLGLTNGEAKES